METKLDSLAWIIIILSIFVAIYYFAEGGEFNVIIGIAVIFQGIIWYILLLSMSEIIKLLKRIANIPYYGKISGELRNDSNENQLKMELVGADRVKCDNCETEYSIKKEYCPNCNSKNEYYEW